MSALWGPRSAYENMGRMSHSSVKVISQTPACGWGWGWETEPGLTWHHVTHRKHMFSSIRPFADNEAHSCADEWRLKGVERTALTKGDRGLCWWRGISVLISWSTQIELESVNQASGVLAVGAVCSLGFTLSHFALRPRRKAFWFYKTTAFEMHLNSRRGWSISV